MDVTRVFFIVYFSSKYTSWLWVNMHVSTKTFGLANIWSCIEPARGPHLWLSLLMC